MEQQIECPDCKTSAVNLLHNDLHGYAVRCAKCNKFLRWTGKAKEKGQKNQKHRKEHKKNGELVCDWCGINEGEAKSIGMHFQIDHRVAEDFGGEDTFENTRALCSGCHYEKTAKEHTTRAIKKLLEKMNSDQEMLQEYIRKLQERREEAPF